MPQRGRLVAVVAVAAAGLLVGGLLLVGATTVGDVGTERRLVVETDDGTEVLTTPVGENSTVVLEYTHSVEKTTVRDVYEVRSEQLLMTRMEFHSFGAGLPSGADVERTDDGSYVYQPAAQHRDELVVSTGRVAGHELVVDERRYDLVGLADAGTVRIRVTTRLSI